MCGIAGIFDRKERRAPPLDALRRMAKSIVHRGPDEFGLYRDDAIGLVHTRLSIVDLTSGQQPLANEDETIFVVFNGEIFNFVELREELVEKGHVFRTRSDTEVIVHAFETWGEEAFTRFNGQFAIALWDTVRKRLVLARDRFGVRPLHFAESDGAFYFASEAKAIFAAAPSLSRAFDPIGLDQTLTFWAPIAPRTPFAAISELPPGHVMILDGASTTTRPFVELGFPASPDEYFRGTLDEAREAVHAALEKATRLRIVRADVPVGSYLSGGLDSSLLAALAIGQREGRLSTFSLRFADAEYDETSYQREMVERIGSDHHEIVVERRAIADAFPRAVAHAERMILRTAPVPLMLLSGLVRDHGIKVVLTGEGADEMFGGYDIFREGKVRRFWAKRPDSTLRPLLLDRLYPYLARSPVAQRAMARRFFGKGLDRYAEPGFAHEPRWSGTSALKRFFAPHVSAALTDVRSGEAFVATLPEAFRSWAPLSQDQYIEIRTLLSSYLLSSQGDRMLMAHSVEGRFPFLDVDVAALANRLPPSYKLRVLDEKHVLKRVARGLLPPSILERPKQPYRAPDALAFLADPRPEWVSDLLSTETSRRVGVFEPALVEGMWAKLSSRREDTQVSNTDNMALVGVLSLHLLHREVLTKTYASGDDLSFRTFIDRSTLA